MTDAYDRDDALGANSLGGGGGLLGLIKTSNTTGRDPNSDPLPPGYAYRPDGALQLLPDFAKQHPKGPFDWKTAGRNIHWDGVLADLATIGAGAVTGAGLGEIPGVTPQIMQTGRIVGGLLGSGARTWKAQQDANRPPMAPDKAKDRSSSGVF